MPSRNVETVLMELERAVEPSQDFADSLFAKLVVEFERTESPDLSVIETAPRRPRMWERLLTFPPSRRAMAGLALLIAVAVLATNLLPQTQTTAFAIVQEARQAVDSLPSFEAEVVRRMSGTAIAEETLSGELPDLEVRFQIHYRDASHWRVDVVENSYDPYRDFPEVAEAAGSYTVADGDYVVVYSRRNDVLTAMPFDDFRGPEPIGLLDPALTSFDLSDDEVREDCEPLEDREIIGRVAHGISCQDREITGIDNEVWFDNETGLILSILATPEPGVQLPPGEEGGGHYIEVLSLITDATFDDEFSTEPPSDAAVLWQGRGETPEVFRQATGGGLEVHIGGQGGDVLVTEAGVWAESVQSGRGAELTEGIGRLVLLDPTTGELLSVSVLDPLHDEQPKRWIGPLATVDSVIEVDDELWVNVDDAGSTERVKDSSGEVTFRYHSKVQRLDVNTGKSLGPPVQIDGNAIALAAGEGSVWLSVAETRPKIIGTLHTSYGDVLRLDANSGKITDVVRPTGGPIGETAIVAAGHFWSPWLLMDETDIYTSETVLLRVNTNTMNTEFVELDVPDAYSTWIDGDDEMLWVVTNAGERRGALLRIDPDSGDIVDRRDLSFGPIGVSVGAGRVWTLDMTKGRLVGFDPSTLDQVGAPIRVAAQPNGLDATDGAVWVNSHQDGVVTRVTVED